MLNFAMGEQGSAEVKNILKVVYNEFIKTFTVKRDSYAARYALKYVIFNPLTV